MCIIIEYRNILRDKRRKIQMRKRYKCSAFKSFKSRKCVNQLSICVVVRGQEHWKCFRQRFPRAELTSHLHC